MEQLRALKQMESKLALLSDHVSVMSGKLEDLLFRAQRIAATLKDNSKAKVSDTMFGYDLGAFRRDVRAFGNNAGGLSSELGGIERFGQYDEACVGHAQAVMRFADRLHKGMAALLDKAVLAHQHIREAEHKVEAWYMVQEVEALAQQTQVLPGVANKVILVVSTQRKGAPASAAPHAPAGPASPPATAPTSAPAAPTLRRRAAVPLRPVGRMVSPPPASPPAPQQA